MNSDTTVNNLHTIICFLTTAATMFGVTLPVQQVNDAEKGIIAVIGLICFVASWINSHRHHKSTAQGSGPSAPVEPANSTTKAANAIAATNIASIATLFILGFIFASLTGCAILDPSLPGQTTPAPLIAFTNGSAYILGHPASSNEVYSATLAASKLGTQLLIKEVPDATNYLPDAQLIFGDIACNGAYNQADLTNALGQIPLQNPDDKAVLDSIISSGLSLVGAYVGPLATGGTNSGPYVTAALRGIADGL